MGIFDTKTYDLSCEGCETKEEWRSHDKSNPAFGPPSWNELRATRNMADPPGEYFEAVIGSDGASGPTIESAKCLNCGKDATILGPR